jgi:hypothetical protein
MARTVEISLEAPSLVQKPGTVRDRREPEILPSGAADAGGCTRQCTGIDRKIDANLSVLEAR